MFTKYEDALEWIHSRRGFGPKPGNSRMEWMMERLGHPERKIKAIHIAGTNGKGSTVAYLASLFKSSGYSVGSFTSPHILSFNERISLDGEPLSNDDVIRLANQVYPLYEEISQTEWGGMTEFEVITTMMFLHFASVQPDVVLIETGLGGLYDSTNVVQPQLSVITTIGFDHVKILGGTIEEIAFQKAGIIKNGTPVILGNIDFPAKQVLLENAARKQAPAESFKKDFQAENPVYGTDFREKFDFKSRDTDWKGLEISLMGQHQIENAAVALQAFHTFCRLAGYSYTEAEVREGLRQAFWPVRLEILSRQPFVMLDGAHNEPAMKVLLDALEQHFSDKKIQVLYASLTTKELEKIGPWLEKIPGSRLHLTSFDFPNAADAAELKRRLNVQDAELHADWQKVVNQLCQEQGRDEILLITGSLYFLSDVRHYLLESEKSPIRKPNGNSAEK